MKQVKLFIYNYGRTLVADFKNNGHDAFKAMKMFNDELIVTHGQLPERTFYYVMFKLNGKDKVSVFFDGMKLENGGNNWDEQSKREIFIKNILFSENLIH